MAHACHSSYTGNINRRVSVQANQDINVKPYFRKITKVKRAGGVGQVVELLA
jgi:hypothetical protein